MSAHLPRRLLGVSLILGALLVASIGQGDPGETKPLPKEFNNSIGMKLALIPKGKFLMGSPKEEEGRIDNEEQHEVEITRPFYMGVHTVTVGQFRKFVTDAGYQTEAEKEGKGGKYDAKNKAFYSVADKATWKDPGFEQEDSHPVLNVSWNDAMAFCAWLAKKEGKTYRLPTEAEWEYACRAGTTTCFHSGNADASLRGVANIADKSLKEKWNYKNLADKEIEKQISAWFDTVSWDDGYPFTAPVGSFKANAFGLYDMHGNVWQWCADWYDKDYYKNSPRQDPPGAGAGELRIYRGGSFTLYPRFCRSAHRQGEAPSARGSGIGFRVVCVP